MGIQRFSTVSEAVSKLTETFGIDRQKATHIVWDFEMTIGTDRAIWLDFDRIQRVEFA